MRTYLAVLAATAALVSAGQAQATAFVQYNLVGTMAGTRTVQPSNGPASTQNVAGNVTFTYLLPEAVSAATFFSGYYLGSISEMKLSQNVLSFTDSGNTGYNLKSTISASACLLAAATNCGAASISENTRDYSLNLNGSISSFTVSRGDAASVTFGLKGYNFLAGAVPEPTTWATMVLGFGLLGAALRRRRLATPAIA